MAISISTVKTYTGEVVTPQTVAAVRAQATATGRVPVVTADNGGTIPGWEKTASNVGLASVGLTAGDLSVYSGLPGWAGGNNPNITGTHTERRFNLGSNTLAPGTNTVFNRCHFEGDSQQFCEISGSNVQFYDCDFVMTGSGGVNRTIINAHTYFGAGDGLVISNARMTGGTVHINVNYIDATISDVYGYGQDPNNNGGAQHRDGFTTRGESGNTLILERCRFECLEGSTTGAFFTQDTYHEPAGDLAGRALTNPIILNQCSFEGGGYCMTLEDAKDLRVTDCRIRQSGSYQVGPYTQTRLNTTVWTDNYVWANSPPLYRGSLISDPA